MSPILFELISKYVEICNKIDYMTQRAMEGEEINLSWYNFLHQCKFAVQQQQIENGVF